MKYPLSEDELRDLAKFEDEVGHSLSAGLDWGDRVGDFFRQAHNSIDFFKLNEMLSDSSLSQVLTDVEIQTLTQNFQKEVFRAVEEKLCKERNIA